MAVLMNKQLGFIVEGGYRATADIRAGQFVDIDYENGTASVASTPTANTKLVLQRNDTIDEQAVADSEVIYKAGEFVPLRTLQLGDVFTTDEFGGTFVSIEKGDEFVVGAGGQVVAGTIDGLGFVVKDKTSLFGNEAVKLEVVSV